MIIEFQRDSFLAAFCSMGGVLMLIHVEAGASVEIQRQKRGKSATCVYILREGKYHV